MKTSRSVSPSQLAVIAQNNSGKADKNVPVVLTVIEVARIFRVARNSIYQAVARGEVPSLRFGRKIVIPRHSIEQMINSPGSKIGDRL